MVSAMVIGDTPSALNGADVIALEPTYIPCKKAVKLIDTVFTPVVTESIIENAELPVALTERNL
jgi:hypothetical protein